MEGPEWQNLDTDGGHLWGLLQSSLFFSPSGRSFEWAGYLETIRKEAVLFVLMIYLILAEKGYDSY